MPQHRIVQRSLAIAVLAVVPVIDLQTVLQFQMAAVRRAPFAQQKRKFVVENKMIFAAGMLHLDLDCLVTEVNEIFAGLNAIVSFFELITVGANSISNSPVGLEKSIVRTRNGSSS